MAQNRPDIDGERLPDLDWLSKTLGYPLSNYKPASPPGFHCKFCHNLIIDDGFSFLSEYHPAIALIKFHSAVCCIRGPLVDLLNLSEEEDERLFYTANMSLLVELVKENQGIICPLKPRSEVDTLLAACDNMVGYIKSWMEKDLDRESFLKSMESLISVLESVRHGPNSERIVKSMFCKNPIGWHVKDPNGHEISWD